MSQVKKVPKSKKLVSLDENSVLPPEPKQRKSRTKPKPTKEEAIKMLQDASNDLKQIIIDLREDEQRVASLQLKKVPELIKETLCNLAEDQEEIEEQLTELRNSLE